MHEIPLTLDNLQSYLKSKELDPQHQKETDQICLHFKQQNVELSTFLKIMAQGELLQCITYLPFKVKTEKMDELRRTLIQLNNELDLPGFSLDEKNGYVFYRLVLPCIEKQLHTFLLDRYLTISKTACLHFLYVLDNVINKKMKFEDAIRMRA